MLGKYYAWCVHAILEYRVVGSIHNWKISQQSLIIFIFMQVPLALLHALQLAMPFY